MGRGEVTARTLRRKRGAPPPHVLARMTDEQKALDKVARGVSNVGYTGMVKHRLGAKSKEESWNVEDGGAEEQARLDELERSVMAENARRRADQEESGES